MDSEMKKHGQNNFYDVKKILVLVSDGSDMSEVVQVTTVTKIAGYKVVIASIDDSEFVKSSSDVMYRVDSYLSEVLKDPNYDALVLPGGLLGSKALGDSLKVRKLLEEYEKNGSLIVAIGDATPVLRKNFIGFEKTLTSHPLVRDKIEGSDYMKYKYIDDDVFVDGKIVTCRGGPATLQCALNIVHLISGRLIAENVAKELLIDYDDGFCKYCCGNCKYCCSENKKKLDPDIADRFSSSNCCSWKNGEDEDLLNWEEDKAFNDIMDRENMIIVKLRREEIKDEEEDRKKEREELDEEIEYDKEEFEKRRRSYALAGCVTQEVHERYAREYAEKDEASYQARMKKIHDRLYARIERSNRRRDFIEFMRDADPSEIDSALANIK